MLLIDKAKYHILVKSYLYKLNKFFLGFLVYFYLKVFEHHVQTLFSFGNLHSKDYWYIENWSCGIWIV